MKNFEVLALLEGVINALVDRPELITISVVEEDNSAITFRVQAPTEEMGKLIGKHGRTARSLRTLMTAVSMKQKRRFHVELAETPHDADNEVFKP